MGQTFYAQAFRRVFRRAPELPVDDAVEVFFHHNTSRWCQVFGLRDKALHHDVRCVGTVVQALVDGFPPRRRLELQFRT